MPSSIYCRPCFCALLFAIAGAAYAQDEVHVPESVLAAWEPRWSSSVDEVLTKTTTAYDKGILAEIAPEQRTAIDKEMRQAFLKEFAWSASGRATVEDILLQACGIDLLRKLDPYYSGELPPEQIPEDLKSASVNCSVDADLYVSTVPAYKMLEFAKSKLPSLFHKYGIDPRGQ